ncbi:MAG: TRAP transporter small permease [Pseudomonadota bacterium]|nr:TRAP transporter small permease [Pseudomonadota bacterium]MEC9369948.1 TRAP transporter small permease [Pseudomonadota bacterium]MED5228927.1 TRAP transporter small permease [Pseudomonadota bacterium]MEE3282333.1 TRAP transporter small permease [Pseudomonadota bacterium]
MHELLLIFCIVLVVGAVITALAVKAAALLFLIERYLTYASAAIIIGVMCFVGAEVFMRYVLNSPIPGHLEGSELLVCIIVFFAVAYTQSLKGHVGMTLIIESLPEKTKKILEIITLLLSVATCAILSYFSFKYAYNCWIIGDITMSPPFFPVWPSALAIPIGYMFLAMRMYLQALHLLVPDYYPANEITDESALFTEEVTN